jgi:hypothetical protein
MPIAKVGDLLNGYGLKDGSSQAASLTLAVRFRFLFLFLGRFDQGGPCKLTHGVTMPNLIDCSTAILRAVVKEPTTVHRRICDSADTLMAREGNACVYEILDLILNCFVDSGVVVFDPKGSTYQVADQSPFGFHLNEATQREDRKIVFGSVTTGTEGTGPATSLHMFYSVEEAKTLVHQLLIAIAQAEATATHV